MSNAQSVSDTDIAVVGMAGRFPGARSLEQFWANLRDGVEPLTEYSDEELRAAGVPESLLRDPDYVRTAFELPDMEHFDPGFFGLSPRDAAIMDPQQRHFLEVVWEALEAAGHVPGGFEGSVGVFAGCGASTYLMFNLLTRPELLRSVGYFLLRHTGNDKDFLATRVSYQYDLRGPSINVQTACSTSLVAVHLACQSLLNGECDLAIAGGATVKQPHRVGYLYREGEILSSDGHCRAFDARSEGTVFGSGVGAVVLRRLADALADGDHVHAVIKGSAVNNDGAAKVGYLAPSVDGQAQAIAEAIAVAGVDPQTIRYVEAHGTGTPVGDPIEVAALKQAFGPLGGRGRCAIGSLKSNIGHLDTASGIAGLIKTVLALEHRQLPPTLHFREPNPACALEDGPFYVQDRLEDWTRDGAPRRAGVSSLGAGGTNAHVVLEEAPAAAPSAPAARPWQLLTVSARSAAALQEASGRLAAHLRSHPEQPLADVAFTLQRGRRSFPHRRVVVAQSAAEAAEALQSADPRSAPANALASETRRSVVFLFAGGGAQYPGMGQDLYRHEPAYRAAVDECLVLLDPLLAGEVRRVLFPTPAQAVDVERPSLALPSLFITQYALARLAASWGVRPSAMLGHSMGEYTAAHLAGIFSLRDALALVALRGRLFERVPEGGMLSVSLAAEELRPLLGPALSVAAVNAPELCVAAGPTAALEALERELEAREVEFRRIHISIAAHSAMLDPILPEFRAFFDRVSLHPPTLPFLSNVTGTWITAAEATSPEYWVRHLRNTVRFAEGVGELLQDPDRLLLEVGPGRTLATLARLHPDYTPAHGAIHSMRHPDDEGSDVAAALGALGRLWAHGLEVEWERLHEGEERRRVPLPTYPFEHQPYYIEPGEAGAPPEEDGPPPRRDAVQDWFYQPSWRRALRAPAPADFRGRRFLLLQDELGVGSALGERLAALGAEVTRVRRGGSYRRAAPDEFVLDPAEAAGYETLLAALAGEGRAPGHIVHFWTLDGPVQTDLASIERQEVDAFYSLLHLAQAIGREDLSHPIRLTAVSAGVHQVAGEQTLVPARALLTGPLKVIGKELPNVGCHSVDVQPAEQGSRAEARLLEQLLAELGGEAEAAPVALRGPHRWVQTWEPAPLAPATAPPPVRPDGVYLLTGGLGGIALEFAGHLARAGRVRLVLVGRSPLPPREEWESWLTANPGESRTGRRIRKLLQLEELGAEVILASADVADPVQMTRLVQLLTENYGGVNGVLHTAGVLRDGLILAKEDGDAAAVLRPKVRGTLALHQALGGTPLDFFYLFSSRSSVSGIAGQVDYTAANAFLDAFAHFRTAVRGEPTLAVNWSAWQEVGMVAELARGDAPAGEPEGEPAGHPLLDRRLPAAPGEESFGSRFRLGERWILDEHRIRDGEALIPGTGYLELARAAFDATGAPGSLELRDVFFLQPFVVHPGEERELRVHLHGNGDGSSFRIEGASGAAWTEHVQGTIAALPPSAPPRVDIAELRARCDLGEQVFTERHRTHLDLGPRWNSLRRIHFGSGELLAELELPGSFAGDLEEFRLHPALLDVATGCGQPLIPGFDEASDFFVPASYTRVRVRAPLRPRLFSHIRYRPGADDPDLAAFDVTLYDENGVELVDISEFLMLRVHDRTAMEAAAPAPAAEAPRPLAVSLEEAIRTEEGIDAFARLLAAGASLPAQVVVSPQDLPAWLRHLLTPPAPPAAVSAGEPLEPVDDVEAALGSHPAVGEAAAVGRRERGGALRVVAYVVHRAGAFATASELRDHLRERLPEERVPRSVVELDSLPRLPDGAVDRRALPDPFGAEDDHVAPGSEMERLIAGIWSELLGVPRVSLHDNFLDIGGHSLLAMRAVTRIAKQTGVRLSQSALNLHTLAQVAAECEQKQAATTPARPNGGAPAPEQEPGRPTALHT